jgi:hypothetical protein
MKFHPSDYRPPREILEPEMFFLSDESRSALEEQLATAFDKNQPLQDALVEDIITHLPTVLIEQIHDYFSFKRVRPILLGNVPERPLDSELEDIVSALGRDGAPSHFMAHWLSEALLSWCHAPMKKSRLLLRTPGSEAQRTDLRLFHRDIHAFTILTCIANSEDAPTTFIDLRIVLEELSEEQKSKIVFGELWSIPAMNLLEFEAYDRALRLKGEHRRHGIWVHECSDPNSVTRFNELLEERSYSITLEPGQMLLWHNSVLHHRANDSVSQPAADKLYSRVVLFAGGEQNSEI